MWFIFLFFQSHKLYIINGCVSGTCLYEGCDAAVVGEVDSVVSNNLEAPRVAVRLCPAQLRPGGLQVF